MLARTIRWSLERPRLIAVACLALVIWGALSLRGAAFDLLPEVAPAETTIHTEAPGLVAEQVETLVTHPIEAAILGAVGVARVHSGSVQGLSIVTVTFAPKADPVRVREALGERLATLAGTLPSGVSAPRLAPLTSTGGRILRIGFTSDTLDAMALRDEIDWAVRPRLLAAAGVGRVSVYGGLVRRLEVRARPADLADSDLGFLDILNAVKRASSVAGAGFIDTDAQRVLIEPRGQALTKADIGAGQIQSPGSAPVRIEDVSDVSEAPAPPSGDALVSGRPAVIVDVSRQYGANTLAATHAVEAILSRLTPGLQAKGIGVHAELDRPASYEVEVVRGVAIDLAIGAALIVVGLVIFTRDLRVAAVSLVSIPVSLVGALVALRAFGWSLNAMTIGGLALGLGVVIDDAVIDLENIVARLRDAEGRRASRLEGILAASLQVRAPVVYATLAMIVALCPMLALRGPVGALLSPLAGAAILTCITSLIVAVLITPTLALLFLGHVGAASRSHLLQRASDAYGALLTRVDRRPWPAAIVAGLLVGLAIISLLMARTGGWPSSGDGQLRIAIGEPAGTSLEVSRAYGERAAAELGGIRGVRAVSERIGRDPEGDDAWGTERGVIELALDPGELSTGRSRIAAEAAARLRVLPGLNPVVADPGVGDAGGDDAAAPVRIRVFDEDLDALDATASRLAAVLRAVPGAGATRDETSALTPVVRADINFQRLALYGLSSSDVLDTVQAAFAGESVGKIYVGNRIIDLAVSAQQSLRQDPERVGDLLLRSTSGVSVPLRAVADVYLTDGRAMITHDGGFRSRTIAEDPKDATRFMKAAAHALAGVGTPPGAFVQVDSVYPAQKAARNGLIADYGLALLAVLAVLAVAFDGRTAAIILGSSVFSLIGAAVAVALMGQVLSPGALIGLVALFGLSLRAAILLFDRLEDVVLSHQASWSLATVAAAARERMVPIVTTAMLVALVVAPLAAHAHDPGREILGPMAIVIISGLLTGTVGTLFVLPSLIFALWRPAFARRARHHGRAPQTGAA